MHTENNLITVSRIPVEIVRKPIKNLHLGVYPPMGRVRVATPITVSDEAVRLAVISKLGWIKRQQAKFREQFRQTQREFVSGETHYFQGRGYRLKVVEHTSYGRVFLKNKSSIELHVRADADREYREYVVNKWYREQLKAILVGLFAKWENILGVKASSWGVKKMKTKWGSCNREARRIWLNLELAKKPLQCLEYIVVHELAHLIERHHNDRFISVLDLYLPNWRSLKDELNNSPLAHEEWSY